MIRLLAIGVGLGMACSNGRNGPSSGRATGLEYRRPYTGGMVLLPWGPKSVTNPYKLAFQALKPLNLCMGKTPHVVG